MSGESTPHLNERTAMTHLPHKVTVEDGVTRTEYRYPTTGLIEISFTLAAVMPGAQPIPIAVVASNPDARQGRRWTAYGSHDAGVLYRGKVRRNAVNVAQAHARGHENRAAAKRRSLAQSELPMLSLLFPLDREAAR
jgi:hypothetical protein